jgi:hypothetical protein
MIRKLIELIDWWKYRTLRRALRRFANLDNIPERK